MQCHAVANVVCGLESCTINCAVITMALEIPDLQFPGAWQVG
jgi:hypothetical protein